MKKKIGRLSTARESKVAQMKYEFLNEKEIFYIDEISEKAERIYGKEDSYLRLSLISDLTEVLDWWRSWEESEKDDYRKVEYIEHLKDSMPSLLFVIHKSCNEEKFDLLGEYNYQNSFTKNKENLTPLNYFLTIRFNRSAKEMERYFYHVIKVICGDALAGACVSMEYIYMIIEELGITLEEVLEYTWNKYIKWEKGLT